MADKKGAEEQTDLKTILTEIAKTNRETMLEFAKEIIRDPEAEALKARKEAEAKDMAETTAAAREVQRLRRAACSHKREWAGVIMWNVAWAPYADDVPRGVCKTCHDEFAPGHPRYQEMLTNGSTAGYTLTYHR